MEYENLRPVDESGEPILNPGERPINEAEFAAEAGVVDEVTSTSDMPRRTSSDAIKDAWKQVENLGQAVGAALQSRGNVVMVRINDEALRHLDMLVEAEVVKSRSEAAALLINSGIQANQQLFERISEITTRISALRAELRESVQQRPLE